jgi:hypothetical protein
MAEKFDRNPEIPSHQDAYKKTYFIKEDKVENINSDWGCVSS